MANSVIVDSSQLWFSHFFFSQTNNRNDKDEKKFFEIFFESLGRMELGKLAKRKIIVSRVWVLSSFFSLILQFPLPHHCEIQKFLNWCRLRFFGSLCDAPSCACKMTEKFWCCHSTRDDGIVILMRARCSRFSPDFTRLNDDEKSY